MNDLINNEFFQKPPEEVKEQLKNCKSEEEAMEILRDNMIEIPEEMMDSVAGGKSYLKCGCFSEYGDLREDVSSGQAAKDFEEGRITGAVFFE